MPNYVKSKDKYIKMECPNKSKHTKCPEAYLQWHDWADKKSKTHKQIKCEGCGLYVIWVKK
jgi:hypothetical protein